MKKLLSMIYLMALVIVVVGCSEAITTEEDPIIESDLVQRFTDYDDLKSYFDNMEQRSYFTSSMEGDMATPEMATDDQAKDEAPSYSETNVQVEGIMEMDSIITDGYYIYMARNSFLRIIDVESMTVIYENELETGYYSGIYLYENRLVSLYTQYEYNDDDQVRPYYDFWWGVSNTHISVLDVSDKTDIQETRHLEFENTYLYDSRMIEGELYLLMNSYSWYYEDDVWVPMYSDSVLGEEMISLGFDDIYYFPESDLSNAYLLIGSFSVMDDQEIDLNAYLGYAFEVYMSHQNLYLSGYQYIYDEETQRVERLTNILRFEIVDNKLVFRAANQIKGWTLNQFSFDEYEGVLRVATTDYEWDGETMTINNQLYLLDATDEELTQISVLEGLGKPGERIYAVRMSGDTGYVVTFQNIDPLYKLDLSDPENPFKVGELEEEGVSDYLHPIGDDLMIGIGRQADASGEFTVFTGVKVALYDVSGDDPVTIETLLVEGEYSYSPVTYNHKLFVEYDWNESLLFAIPVFGYSENYDRYYQGVYVYQVDGRDISQVALLMEETELYYYSYIEKAIFIGDSVYTISYAQINEFDMNNDFERIDTLILEERSIKDDEITTEDDETHSSESTEGSSEERTDDASDTNTQ